VFLLWGLSYQRETIFAFAKIARRVYALFLLNAMEKKVPMPVNPALRKPSQCSFTFCGENFSAEKVLVGTDALDCRRAQATSERRNLLFACDIVLNEGKSRGRPP